MTTAESPTFGALLRLYRVQAGLTQEALAERAHLSRRAIAALEQGINRVPRATTVALLTEALALSAPARAALVAASRPAARTAPPTAVTGSRAPLLVGRTCELALLDHHLTGEGPPLLLLAGEPGIGKSRLLQEAASRGAAAGWQILWAGCARSGGQLPYTPLLQALQRQISDQPAAQQRTALRGCAWLVRLLPELAGRPIEPLPPWTVSPEQERRLMFEAVERFLAQVAGPAGTLLLDDLHWAGADALDLLATLARTPATDVRIVGAYRDTELGTPDLLSSMLADLAHAGLVRHQMLLPLAPEEAHQLLHAVLGAEAGEPSALATRVVQRTGGVPFFVVSYAQALRGQRADAAAIPWNVAQGIRRRVADLSPLAQEVLGATAIAVRRVAQVAVLERPEREVLPALEAAWRAGLLDDAEGDFRIAHDLIREVLEDDLGPARREMLHRRTAEVLEARPGGASAEVLAFHYAQSDRPDRAVGYWEQAGDAARNQGALAAASDYYREAVIHLDRLSRSIEAARVWEKLGTVLQTAAHCSPLWTGVRGAAYGGPLWAGSRGGACGRRAAGGCGRGEPGSRGCADRRYARQWRAGGGHRGPPSAAA